MRTVLDPPIGSSCAPEAPAARARASLAAVRGGVESRAGPATAGRARAGPTRPRARAPALEEQLAARARARAPLRAALATLAARLVETRAWERLGFARLADYARERAGLSARQLQDLACTGRRLSAMPALEAALLGGTLPWTKVRLVARVAGPADEAAWLALAQRLTASALEREVRAADRGSVEAGALELDADGLTTSAREGVVLRCTPRTRHKLHRARQLARRVAGEALPMWACMEAVAAEAASALGLAAAEDESDPEPEPQPDALEPARDTSWRDRRERASRAPPGGAASRPCAAAPGEGPAGSDRAHTAPDRALAGPAPAPGAARPTGSQPSSLPAAEAESSPRRAGAAPSRHAIPAHVRTLTQGVAEADAFELDARLRRAIALEQRLDAELAPLLRAAAERRLHASAGLPSFAAYARERLGLSPRKARALMRLDRLAARCPALRRAFAEGALSWIQAQAVLPVLVLPEAERFQGAWIAYAAAVSVRRLEDDAAAAVTRLEVDSEGFRRTGGLPEDAQRAPAARAGAGLQATSDAERQIRAPARGAGDDAPDARAGDAEGSSRAETSCDGSRTAAGPDPTWAEAETARFFFTGPPEAIRLFRAVVCSVRRHLGRAAAQAGVRIGLVTQGTAVEWMLDHAFETWGADDPRVRREHRVFERDGWRCTVPGCSSYRNLHDHHVVFRSAGGSDAPANRTTLCAFHHLRGVHAGRVRCTGRAPDGLHFALGLRSGQQPLLRYGPGERRRA